MAFKRSGVRIPLPPPFENTADGKLTVRFFVRKNAVPAASAFRQPFFVRQRGKRGAPAFFEASYRLPRIAPRFA